MFLGILRRGPLARSIIFCFAVTVVTCLLLAITTPLTGDDYAPLRDPEKIEALETLCQLPENAEKQISWGYLGAYGTSPNQTKSRVAFWEDNIDSFLSKAPDTEIANLASLFTEPNVIAILRQLVDGTKSIADLAQACNISESEVEKTLETLMKATLVVRTEDNLIKPHNDAVSFFLNFVSMTIVHLGHTKSDR